MPEALKGSDRYRPVVRTFPDDGSTICWKAKYGLDDGWSSTPFTVRTGSAVEWESACVRVRRPVAIEPPPMARRESVHIAATSIHPTARSRNPCNIHYSSIVETLHVVTAASASSFSM